MKIWYILLLTTFFCTLITRAKDFNQKHSRIVWILCIFLLCFFAGIRTKIGDTDNYLLMIENIPLDFNNMMQMLDFSKEWGFKLLLYIIKILCFGNSQATLAVISTITICLIGITFEKTTKYKELALYIFIASSTYIMLMNGVRQFLVVAILFASYELICQKKWKVFFIEVLILSTIHKSVLVMIPAYFILNSKLSKKKILLISIVSLALFLSFNAYSSYILKFLKYNDSSYYYYAIEFASGENGGNFIRVLVALVPIIFSLYNWKQIKIKKDGVLFVNASILNAVFYLLAVKHYIFARISFYFILFSLVLLCWNIESIKDRNIRFFIYCICMFLYFVYYYYQVNIIWNTPYTTIFS